MHVRIGALAALALTWLPSCTLLGLGTGATVDAVTAPHYSDPTTWPLKEGEHIRAVTRAGNRIEGFYAGLRPPTACNLETQLLVRQSSGVVVALPYSDVQRIGVERAGKGWLYGTLIGAALDVTVIVALLIAPPDLGGCLGCTDPTLTLK